MSKFNLDNVIKRINFTSVQNFKTYKERFDFSFLEATSGVYGIKNLVTGKIYIGATKNIKMRLSNHFGRLRRGIHKVKDLQQDFNLQGKGSFELVLFNYCEEDDMEFFEEAFFISFKPNCYNKRLSTQTNVGLFLSKDSKKLMGEAVSKAHKGKMPKNINLIRSLQKRAIVEYTDNVETCRYDSCKSAGEVLGVCYKRINRILVKNKRNEKVNPLAEFPNKTWYYVDNKPVRIINRAKDEPR